MNFQYIFFAHIFLLMPHTLQSFTLPGNAMRCFFSCEINETWMRDARGHTMSNVYLKNKLFDVLF